jgi:short-subunit dehydrogenase
MKEANMRDLRNATVVIAGASSGIGRAAALAFAREGANVVLLARRDDALDDAARECRNLGGRALAVPIDVRDAAAVRAAAKEALKFTGRIDVWVNNAGVGAVGRFTDTPIEAHDATVQTNLLGYMHGAHAVLPYFQRQKTGGVLINTLSFGAWVPAPFAAAYSASKFGLRGFSDALRAELGGYPQIHVCDVFPSFMDTPGVQHAANYTGRALKPAPPVYSAARAADAMVELARNPRSSVTVGSVATLARLGYFVAPGIGRWVMRNFIETYLAQAKPAAVTSGGVLRPVRRGQDGSGGWARPRQRVLAGSVGLTLAAALAGFVWSQRRGSS